MVEMINHTILLFGGKFYVLELTFWCISLFILNSLIEKNSIRFITSFLSSAWIILQLSSLYFTQTFIGYRFFVHLNLRGIDSMLGLYIPQLILFIISLILIFYTLYKSKFISSFVGKKLPFIKLYQQKIVLLIITFVLLSFSLWKGHFLEDTRSLFLVFTTNSENFKAVLERNNMNSYVSPNRIQAKKGKNIIVISLESFERSFLEEDKFRELTPNLRNLKNNWNYLQLEQNHGSDWTSGSLYSYLTGFPAFFGVYGNSIFQTSYHSDISSISQALNIAGYNTIYMNGNTDHSGVKEMLNVFDFKEVIDNKNVEEKEFESDYGLRDKDLFDIAKRKILEEEKKNENFALFISTTDTHFPDGIYDSRMEKVVSKKKNDYDFMLASVDYMVGDFVKFLDNKKLLENTVVYIFPDHLKMGDPSIFEYPEERGLYVLSNSSFNNNKGIPIFQIDLPKIILNGADVKHNMIFFTDYLKNISDKNQYIKEHLNEITAINTSGFLRYDSKFVDLTFNPALYNKIKKDTSRFIAHAGGTIKGFSYTNSLEALNLSYNKGFRLFELDIMKTSDGEYVAVHGWDEWKDNTNFSGEIPVSLNEFRKHKIHNQFTPLDLKTINKWFSEHKDAILVTDKINEPELFAKLFVDKKRLMMELFDIEAVKQGIKTGILSAMPSNNIIDQLKPEDLISLKKMGVKNIAVSRRFIYINPELLQECLKVGIEPYAYHINFDPGIDEDYVLKYEMEFFYGIYADKWDFK